MKKIAIGCTGLLIGTLAPGPAAAWSHSNSWGGSTTHSYGSTTHTDAYGGSVSHTYGQGTTATNRYGGSASHSWGSSSTTVTGRYGGSATVQHSYYGGAYYHGGYYPYHPTYVVPSYSGCYGCAAAGAIVGMAAGAAMASSSQSAATASAYQSGYVAGSANTAATSSAYNAGVAAGTASTTAAYNTGFAHGAAAAGNPVPAAASGPYLMGVSYAALPPGSMAINKGGTTYYLSGNTWFQPSYGAGGVYYQVVSTP